MNPAADEIRAAVRGYIVSEFLPGESPESLGDATPLINSGILDSIGTVRLASFLEEQYGIELEAHEMSVDLMNSLEDIARLVLSKRSG